MGQALRQGAQGQEVPQEPQVTLTHRKKLKFMGADRWSYSHDRSKR